MDKLEQARQIINETDGEIAKLFERRMNAVADVAEYKLQRGLPVLDAGREAQVIAENCAYVNDPVLREYYTSFLISTMEISKRYQRRLMQGMTVAYSGVEGAFAEIASKRIFPDAVKIAFPDFNSAYKAVENGECDCCVLPIENSYAGEVGQVIDLIYEGTLNVTGMYSLAVCQNLLGIKGADIGSVKKVISHPQALGQCAEYIKDHGFETEEAANTALAAKKVASSDDKTVAAIASLDTAKLYSLEVIDHDINASTQNTTKFAVLTRTPEKPSDTGSFIMLFTVKQVPGALAKAINVIGKYGFNMKALRSRPMREPAWQYYFYVEVDGSDESENGRAMISELTKQCERLKIAGRFKQVIDLGK